MKRDFDIPFQILGAEVCKYGYMKKNYIFIYIIVIRNKNKQLLYHRNVYPAENMFQSARENYWL